MKRFSPNKITLTAALLAVFLSVNCSVKKPQSPRWDTSWDLPLVAKTYGLSQILDEVDDSLIVIGQDGNPTFTIRQAIDTITVGDNLTASGTSQVYADSLGVIELESPQDRAANLNRASIGIPEVGGYVPAGEYNAYSYLEAFDKFSWLLIHHATMSIEIFNDLGIDIDTVEVTICNAGDSLHPLGRALFEDGIDQGQAATRTIDLEEGDSLSNTFWLLTRVVKNEPSLIAGGSDNLSISCGFPSGISVRGAQAESPEITKDLSQVLELTNGSVIAQSQIGSGTFSIEIANGTDLPMTMVSRIPSLRLGDETLEVSADIDGYSVHSADIDLAGYTFSPEGETAPQSVTIEVSVTAPASAPEQRVFKSSDSLRLNISLSDVVFASVTGRCEPTTITIDPIDANLDPPEGTDQAQLTHATLNLNLYNNSTSDADVIVHIAEPQGTKELNLTGRVLGKNNPSDPPRLTVLGLTSEELTDFLNPMPPSVVIEGQAIFNPDTALVTISSNDFFYGEIEISSPLAFRLADTVEVDLDIDEIDINQDDLPDLDETFGYGKITARLTNHLPIGANVSLYLSTRGDSTIFDDPAALVIGPFSLAPAVTDENGLVVEAVESLLEDSLDSNDILIFDNDLVYIAPRVELVPTAGGQSFFCGTDYLRIVASARIKVTMGDNVWDKNR